MGERKERFDRRIAAITVAVAIVSAVLGSCGTWLTLRQSERIAERSGAFDQPAIVATLTENALLPEGGEFVRGSGNRVYFARGVGKEVPGIARLPFLIGNSGQKTLKNVTVTFRFSREWDRALLHRYGRPISAGAITRKDLQIDTSTAGETFFVSYALPSLNPGQGLSLEEPIFMEPVGSLAPPISRPRRLEITVSGEDTPVATYVVDVMIVQAESVGELKRRFIERIDERARSFRALVGLGTYLRLFPVDTESRAYIVYPTMEQAVVEGDTFALADENRAIAEVATYDPIRWDLLLRY